MNGARDGLAQSVQTRLVRHAKDIGVDPNHVLMRYGVERFLYRLSRSRHADRFVLKGALLLLAWLGETLRPTTDADFLGYGDLSDDALVAMIREICDQPVEPDAMQYLADSVTIEPIREEDAYGGRRVKLNATLGPARITLQLDIGIGDAVTPAPELLDYPSLLGYPAPRLRSYPRETVIAEKLHAMVLLGTRNSRMKDYFDVLVLLREGRVDSDLLANALEATFSRRRMKVPAGIPVGLGDAFSHDPAKKAQWRAFVARNRLAAPALSEVIEELRERLRGPLEAARRTRPTRAGPART